MHTSYSYVQIPKKPITIVLSALPWKRCFSKYKCRRIVNSDFSFILNGCSSFDHKY